VDRVVDLAPVGLPVTTDGRLRNYVFVNLRLQLSGAADVDRVRAREPWFRDALVRAAHRRSFSVPGDWTRLDEPALKAEMLRQAALVAGPGQVVAVQLTSATPQRRTGMVQIRR
jgi:hypothetical protein